METLILIAKIIGSVIFVVIALLICVVDLHSSNNSDVGNFGGFDGSSSGGDDD